MIMYKQDLVKDNRRLKEILNVWYDNGEVPYTTPPLPLISYCNSHVSLY